MAFLGQIYLHYARNHDHRNSTHFASSASFFYKSRMSIVHTLAYGMICRKENGRPARPSKEKKKKLVIQGRRGKS